MIRISAGSLKGRRLVVPRHIRASEGKVRQALFAIVGEAIVGARMVDGFAGSGALGVEALSRGAATVVFLESDPASLQAIRRNLTSLPQDAVMGRWEVLRGDALKSLQRLAQEGQRFDVVVLDPPYGGLWGKKSLNVVADCGILAPTGLLCLEHARHSSVPAEVGPLALRKQHRYGETVLSFYQLARQDPEASQHDHSP